MKLKLLLSLVFLSVLASCGNNSQQHFELDQLLGKWVSAEGSFHEEWKKNGTNMLGIGYDLIENDKVNIERLSITEVDGVWNYGADVSNQNGQQIFFQCANQNKSKIIFENPDHDYPQRIIYELKSKGELHIQIEQLDGSRATPFHLVKKEQ